jgi:hypothetical protein
MKAYVFTSILAADTLTSALPNPAGTADGSTIQTALTLLFGIVGALALLMVVISGFRYIIAQDDSQKIAQAKSALVYSLVGVVIAGLAEAIVSYVLGSFG